MRKCWPAWGTEGNARAVRALVLPRAPCWVEGVGAACLRYAALHGPVRGVLVHALCAWRVWWNTAACRDVGDNNLGGELPAQYSVLTSLQFWCVAPYLTRSGVAFGRLAVDDLWSRFDSSLWTSLAAT